MAALASRVAGLLAAALLFAMASAAAAAETRPRARDAGVVIGVLQPGPHNAIVDVPGVAVGHATVVKGNDIRTGATAIVPHGGDLFRDRVPAAIVVGNGFGKLIGTTQVDELGELETPILLTTLASGAPADAGRLAIGRPGNGACVR